jgi:orotate phosphoribosyltransferase-like protein
MLEVIMDDDTLYGGENIKELIEELEKTGFSDYEIVTALKDQCGLLKNY